MIIHNVEQRSPEWFLLRAGIPTASEFHRILTPGGKLSRQAEAYMHSLLAEIVVGHPITGPETEWMQRGQELEDEAIKAYEFQSSEETEPVGFVTTDDGAIGGSPDRFIGDDGILEIKSPKHNTHVGYMLCGALEEEYRPQLQGLLWLCERRKFVYVVSYHPEMPEVIIRIERDDRYIEMLSKHVRAFSITLSEARRRLEEKYGPFPEMSLKAPPPGPAPDEFGVTDQDVTDLLEYQRKAANEQKI